MPPPSPPSSLATAASQLLETKENRGGRGGGGGGGAAAAAAKPPPSKADGQAPSWIDIIDHGDSRTQARARPGGVEGVTADPNNLRTTMADGSSMMLVYCGLLGAVIASLVAWILFKYLRSRAIGGKCQLQHQHHHASLALIPPHSPVYPPPNCQQPTPLIKRQSVDSGFYSSDALASVTNSSRLLKDISESRFHRLENILSNCTNPQGWKALASELGFKEDEVAGFEAQADIVKQSPIRLMLVTWRDRDGSTIGALSRALQCVGRRDALILFKESERHHRHRSQHRGQGRKLPEECSLQEMCQV